MAHRAEQEISLLMERARVNAEQRLEAVGRDLCAVYAEQRAMAAMAEVAKGGPMAQARYSLASRIARRWSRHAKVHDFRGAQRGVLRRNVWGSRDRRKYPKRPQSTLNGPQSTLNARAPQTTPPYCTVLYWNCTAQ